MHGATVYGLPVNAQDTRGAWNGIELLPEPGFGWTGRITGGTVTFPEALGATTPIRLATDDGTIATTPVGTEQAWTAGGALVEDRVLAYPNVLPSTDFVYELTPGGFKELVALKDRSAPTSLSWSIQAPGAELRLEPTGEITVWRGKQQVAVGAPPVIWDSSPSPKVVQGAYSLKPIGPGDYLLELALDPGFVASATYPVTVDPGQDTLWAQGNNDTYVDSANPDIDYRTSWLQVSNDASTKRAFVRFDTTAFQRADRIVYEAELNMYVTSGPGGGPPIDIRRVSQNWPDPLTWNTQPTVDPAVLASGNCANCYGWMSFDVSDMYQHVLQTDIADPWTDYGMRASTDGAATYIFRSADSSAGPALQLSWNDLPAAPTLDRPLDEAVFESDTPTLKIKGGQDWPGDPNNDDVLVQFQISDHPTNFEPSHVVWESPWLDSRSYVVPSGVLTDGQTYYWRARSWDVCGNSTYAMCSYTDALGVEHERRASAVRSFTVVMKHFGKDDRWAMWSRQLGNGMELNVNEANGNLFLDLPLDSLATPVGDLHIGLTYNSQQNADYGLSPGWDLAIGSAGSLRDLPIDLVKLPDFPDEGVKIRFRGNRTSYYPHRDHHVFATVTGGAGVVRQNADGGFTYISGSGDRYVFSQNGRLLEANPVMTTLASGDHAIRYSYDGSELTRVTDPLGRQVNLDWSGGVLDQISTWAGQTWTLSYNPTNGRLREVSVDVRTDESDPLSPSRTETVRMSYVVGAQLPGGLLAEIDDGQTFSTGATGWIADYAEDANGNWRVASLTPPPGGGPQPLSSWVFQYLGEIKGSTAATACITDPLGAADLDAPITCDQGHQTMVDFTWAGFPVRIAGPADQTGYWPVRTTVWDSNNNLICRREPAANAVTEITGANNCKNDRLSTVYTYESEAPFRLMTVTHPSAKPDGTSDRLRQTSQYDSDTNGARYNGLWVEMFDNPNLSGVPAVEGRWTDFDENWGSNPPPGLESTDFSLRWTGYLNTTSNWQDLQKVNFRITSEQGVALVVDNKVLLDCLGTTQPAGTYNCGTNQDVKKWLDRGMHLITIEYSHTSGPASFNLAWQDAWYHGFDPIPTWRMQTNLGLLTAQYDRKDGASSDLLKTVYAFPDDDAQARHLPDSVAVTDVATGVVRKTAYTYNTYGQVKTVTTAAATSLNATTTYSYTNADPISCLVSVEEPDGALSQNTCNAAGDVTGTTQTVRAVPGTGHNSEQQRTTTTVYDTLGRATEVVTPWGGSSSTIYDLAGRPLEVDRYLGSGAGHDDHAVTTNTYDDAGHLVTETLPEMDDPANPANSIRPEIGHVYDWLDDEVTRIDERGNEWTYLYDAFRRLIQTESPSGVITQTEYRLSTAPSGGTDQHTVTTWTAPGASGGVPTVELLNLFDKPRTIQVGTFTASGFLYDVQNRMYHSTDAAGTQTNFTFNAFGDVVTRVDFYGSSKAATTTNTYDAAGRLQTVDGPRTAPVDDSTTYTYDSQDRLVGVTQNGITLPGAGSPGATTTYVWNDADERIQVTQPMSTSQSTVRNWTFDPTSAISTFADARGTTTSTHDLSGIVTEVADPRGVTLLFEHDNYGRLVRRYASGGQSSDDQLYRYDQAGNQISATVVAGAVDITSEYDADGRPWRIYQDSLQPTTTYSYDPATGRLASVVDAAGSTTFGYDANGLLNDVGDPFSSTHVTYTYDTAGRVIRRTDGSGLCWTQSYESYTGRPTVRRVRLPGSNCNGTIRADLSLAYDKASNVVTRNATVTGNPFSGTTTYTYDAANRLTGASGPTAFGSRTYAYDGMSNRISEQIGTGTPVTTSYDDAGLPLSSSDGTTYSHDPLGNLVGIDRPGTDDRYFSYSAWSQLVGSGITPGGSDITYSLDALNRMLSRTAGGTIATYTYQGTGEELAKAEVSGTVTTYAHVPGGPLAQSSSGVVRYYLRDHHGDLVGWANTSASLVGTKLYDPWGQVLSGTGELASMPAQGALGFQADLTDPVTGQVDMNARLYEPTLGRFSSRDHLFGEPTDPSSLNQFVYGAASPVTFSDPSGLIVAKGTTEEGECRACTARILDNLAQDAEAAPGTPIALPFLRNLLKVVSLGTDFVEGAARGSVWLAEQLRQFAWENRGSEARCIPAVCAAEGLENSLAVRSARFVKWGARVLVVLSAWEGYGERRREGQGRIEAAVRQGLETGGGVAGATWGISIGLACGPGAPVCSAFFGAVLGVGGGWLGDKVGDFLFSDEVLQEIGDRAIVDLPTLGWLT